MDVLSDLLNTVRHTSTIRCRGELTAPWGVALGEAKDRAYFYVISRGSCYLRLEGSDESVPLVGGDVVMLSQGSAHTLRDSPESDVIRLDDLLDAEHACREVHRTLRHGGEGTRTAMISGEFHFERRGWHPFLSSMPPLIHLRSEGDLTIPWLEATLRFIAAETGSGSPGSGIMVSRLTDILFIQIVRASMARHADGGQQCNSSIVRALVDPMLSGAVEAIHQRPAHPWTVAELAERAGMSRTAFSTRFSSLTGIPPLSYLTRWRLLKASEMLCQSDAALAEIAGRVGYESEAAFSKAFKREMGMAPGRFRQQWGRADDGAFIAGSGAALAA